MNKLQSKLPVAREPQSKGSFVEAVFIGLDPERRPIVHMPNSEEIVCRVASAIVRELSGRSGKSEVPVLVIVNEGGSPIIVSVVSDFIPTVDKLELEKETSAFSSMVQGDKKVTFSADDELVLNCGKSSLHLRKDGLVVIKGERITSRARQTHKIKGANVLIN